MIICKTCGSSNIKTHDITLFDNFDFTCDVSIHYFCRVCKNISEAKCTVGGNLMFTNKNALLNTTGKKQEDIGQ